jgi:hypothetical protein
MAGGWGRAKSGVVACTGGFTGFTCESISAGNVLINDSAIKLEMGVNFKSDNTFILSL